MRTVLLAILLPAAVQSGGPLFGQLRTLETHDLRLVYYDPVLEYLIPHAARSFENALAFHERLFDYTISEKVTVFLHDFNDYGTGGTSTIPWNYLNIGVEPYDYVYETAPTNERMNWVFNHELAHLVAVDKAAGSDRFFRSLFCGKILPVPEQPISMFFSFLTNPRWYSPRWYHEGIATFLETWMAGGIGRALGGYDEMMFRTMVRDSSYFYDFVGIESEGSTIDFQIGANAYLYGTRFVSYVAMTYGPEKILEWFNRSEGSDAYFASQFEKVIGRSLDDVWGDWIAWEHRWQEANMDSVRTYPVTPYRPLYHEALGSVSREYYDPSTGKLYCGVNYPGRVAHIAEIDVKTGEKRTLVDVPTPTLYYVASLAYDGEGRKIFYTTDNSRNWRDINVLDLNTEESTMLFRDARIGDLVISPVDKTLWGVQHHQGISTLIRIPPPYLYRYESLELAYGNDLFDLDISPDGKTMLGILLEINGRQKLVKMNIDSLIAGSRSNEFVYEFENNSPANFVFSPDGKDIYGTSYYTGVSNIFRINLETKKLDALSNAETGFFRPVPYTEDSIIAFKYTGQGFMPVALPIRPTGDVAPIQYLGQQIVEKYPVVMEWKLDPPNPQRINIDSLTVYKGEYEGLGDLHLASAHPVVEGYKNVYSLGMNMTVSDPLPLNYFNLTGSYSPNRDLSQKERFHASLEYYHRAWKFTAGYNSADFYDLFGPTKTSRKGYTASVNHSETLLEERPRVIDYNVTLSGFSDLDRLPDYQNVAPTLDRFLALSLRLNYSALQRTLGAVDYEKGMKATANLSSKYGREKFFPRLYSTLDLGMILWDHSSLWLRTSAGKAFGDRSNSLVNFYFGGFGNNWVDHGEIRRYRDYYSFPGVEINDVGGSSFVKALLEWDLPPLRFRRVGLPIAYANWARLAFITAGVVTNPEDELLRQRAVNAGAQLDIKMVLFSNLESTLSGGFAAAFRPHLPRSNEWMVSLKILR
ncbi:MAG TPA: hypothetical protein VJO14_00385 [Bacteroidota bacterium]|nr:hypothetical protein [Bacteroidota bacterium]